MLSSSASATGRRPTMPLMPHMRCYLPAAENCNSATKPARSSFRRYPTDGRPDTVARDCPSEPKRGNPFREVARFFKRGVSSHRRHERTGHSAEGLADERRGGGAKTRRAVARAERREGEEGGRAGPPARIRCAGTGSPGD